MAMRDGIGGDALRAPARRSCFRTEFREPAANAIAYRTNCGSEARNARSPSAPTRPASSSRAASLNMTFGVRTPLRIFSPASIPCGWHSTAKSCRDPLLRLLHKLSAKMIGPI